ncbi:cytochrome-c peroxidase [Suttonella sp. R2A3]|uniref:cytochrome-c peroxidase n=1 Tax=Suttonella sp. R2A3 TaxID=2908648 RepID=UPI001F16B86A|nr:cytochrome-c peroxidase [Suttonella sp. R2A3]UJF25085.1 cytochrome-c peroxidase [Suttonella sp. R2A3]
MTKLNAITRLAVAVAVGITTGASVAGELDVGELQKQAQTIFQALPDRAEVDEANPLRDGEIALGQMLYFDPRLSLSGNISCNTCHNLASYGVDNSAKSLGVDAQPGGRNSPTVLNAALNATQFWDGRAQDVEEQAGGPMLNPVEMALPDEATAVQRIAEIPGYQDLFTEVYGDEGVTFKNMTHAIGAFERTLMTPSRFDAFIAGDAEALSEQELLGMQSFIDNGCVACHRGVNLGGDQFQKFGLVKGPYWQFTGSEQQDSGRFEVTQAESDKFIFRVPTLRNVAHTYPYFHDGSVSSLDNAVQIMAMAQLGKELPEADIANMVAFLETLSGEVSEEARTLPILPKSVFPDEIIEGLSKAEAIQ